MFARVFIDRYIAKILGQKAFLLLVAIRLCLMDILRLRIDGVILMAINSITMSNVDYSEYLETIKDFIETNNPDLFDHMEINKMHIPWVLNCYKNEQYKALTIRRLGHGTSDNPFTIYAGSTSSYGTGLLTVQLIDKVYSTSNGILITNCYNAGSPERASVIVANEPDHGLCTAIIGRASVDISREGHVHCNTSYEVEHLYNDVNYTTDVLGLTTTLKTKTMLIPLVFTYGAVTRKLFRMVYNENPEQETVFSLGGARYVSNGAFALLE